MINEGYNTISKSNMSPSPLVAGTYKYRIYIEFTVSHTYSIMNCYIQYTTNLLIKYPLPRFNNRSITSCQDEREFNYVLNKI